MARLTRAAQARIIAAFERTLKRALPLALKDAQRAAYERAKEAQRELADAFDVEDYFNASGRGRRLKSFSRHWAQIKERYRLDPRRGHATNALAEAIASPKALVKTKMGVRYSILLAGSIKRRGPKVKGLKQRKAREVGKYAAAYAESKAPGLGAFSAVANKAILKAADDAFNLRLAGIRRAATLPGSGRRAAGRVGGTDHIVNRVEVIIGGAR